MRECFNIICFLTNLEKETDYGGVMEKKKCSIRKMSSRKQFHQLIHSLKTLIKEFTNIDLIEKKISLGEDLFHRKIKYERIDIDNSFPDYIIKNKDMFKDWIL